MSDKEDIEYSISMVAQEVSSVGANIQDLTNDVRRIDEGIGGPGGVISWLDQLNKNLTVIKWLLGALLLVAVFVLLK